MATSSDKHARQKENRSRVDAAWAQIEAQKRRRRLLGIGGVLVLVAAVIVALVVLTGGSDDEKVASESPDTTQSTAPEASVPEDSVPGENAAVTLPAPPKGETLTTPTECPPVDGSPTRVQKFAGPLPDCLTPGATYSATFDTTEGSFTATLASDVAPKAVNNFVVLSRYHFFDGVPFHRIISEFVIQAGDGDGEPWGNNDLGYSFEDELPQDSSAYQDYSLAMANSGPDTNGSQFFIVLPGGGAKLAPSYTMFGQVTEGQDVIDTIGALNDGAENPTKVILINSVKITETPAS